MAAAEAGGSRKHLSISVPASKGHGGSNLALTCPSRNNGTYTA